MSESIATALMRAVSVLLATMSTAGHRQVSFDPPWPNRNSWYHALIGTAFPSRIWEDMS
jgi:hypothetical protein